MSLLLLYGDINQTYFSRSKVCSKYKGIKGEQVKAPKNYNQVMIPASLQCKTNFFHW